MIAPLRRVDGTTDPTTREGGRRMARDQTQVFEGGCTDRAVRFWMNPQGIAIAPVRLIVNAP